MKRRPGWPTGFHLRELRMMTILAVNNTNKTKIPLERSVLFGNLLISLTDFDEQVERKEVSSQQRSGDVRSEDLVEVIDDGDHIPHESQYPSREESRS